MSGRGCWADGHPLCVDARRGVTVLRVTCSVDADDLQTAAPPTVTPTANREFTKQFRSRTRQ